MAGVGILVLTALALLVARGSAPRRMELMQPSALEAGGGRRQVQRQEELYAPLVQLADAQEGEADAEEGSDGVTSLIRNAQYLPEDLSEGTEKKMATMDRMVEGWEFKKDPREFARDYSADTDRCRPVPPWR